jgi:hypothetical protein
MAGPVRPNPAQISRTPSYSIGKNKYFYTDSTLLQGVPVSGSIAPVVKAPTSIPTVVPPASPPGGSFPAPPAPAFSPQPAHFAFIGPINGNPATPTFRLLIPQDIPNLSISQSPTGVLPVAQGGFPAYTAGVPAASTFHIVYGTITASAISTTYTFVGPEVFTTADYVLYVEDVTALTIAVVTAQTASAFTVTSTIGDVYAFTAIGP